MNIVNNLILKEYSSKARKSKTLTNIDIKVLKFLNKSILKYIFFKFLKALKSKNIIIFFK